MDLEKQQQQKQTKILGHSMGITRRKRHGQAIKGKGNQIHGDGM